MNTVQAGKGLQRSRWDRIGPTRSIAHHRKTMAPPRGIVLTNDDGPPSPDSPFIELFVQTAYSALGLSRAGGESDGENGGNGDAWKSTLHVAIPASQKSWIGKSYLITQVGQSGYESGLQTS